MENYLQNLKQKYNYDNKLIETLRKIIPAFIEYYGPEYEQIILDAIESCNIHIQGEKENYKEYLSEYFNEENNDNLRNCCSLLY